MEGKEIELHSEDVQEIMGSIPSWIVRWGITVLFIVIFTLLIGSYFFKYPDVITTEMTLTSRHPVAQVVSRSSGKISGLYVNEGVNVKVGQPLAVIENAANTEDVLSLENLLLYYQETPDSLDYYLAGEEWSLGNVQATYTGLLSCLHNYMNYRRLDYYAQKKASVKEQVCKYRNYYANQQRQQKVTEAQYLIAQQQYRRDSLLFIRHVISPAEHETARSSFLQSLNLLEGANASLDNLKIQIGQLEESLLDLDLEQSEKEQVLQQEYRTAVGELLNGISGWKLDYCLVSPIDGKVTFTKYWNTNQYIPAGEKVFTVVPVEKEELIGKALLPVVRSGKVEVGQRVIVRFSNYPDQEFGIVNGKVAVISLVPQEDNYTVEIAFPDGLTTNYDIYLPVAQEMKATAEIVTEDLRLIERFFQPLKKILKEGF